MVKLREGSLTASCVTRCLNLDAGGPPVHAARAQQRDLAEADALTNQR